MVRCNLKGGIRLKIGGVRHKLAFGINDVDPELIAEALDKLPPAMATGLTKPKANGMPADLVLDAPADLGDQSDDSSDSDGLNAHDKIELVKLAESLEELRELAEGEERKTVLAAIAKRADDFQVAE